MSLGSYIRSAARGTYSAYRSVPIRWRLAGGSAALTFVILAGFAVIVGHFTNRQIRGNFDKTLTQTMNNLASSRDVTNLRISDNAARCNLGNLGSFAEANQNAQIRIYDYFDGTLLCTQSDIRRSGKKKNPLHVQYFATMPTIAHGHFDQDGYRVVVRSQIPVAGAQEITLLYAQLLSPVDRLLAKVQAYLLLGTLGGAVLALLAGLFVSERAMSPIKELTQAAREIERTEDASRGIPHPEAEDEIAELARTLEGMVGALDASRTRIQRLLDRQREFVADASHELRTPLTSVLANLELLTEELHGQPADTAQAALRSTRRMRRLVGDLLLLARADAERSQPRRPTDLAQVLVDAAAELGPVADHHEVTIDAAPAVVMGVGDELHRLILNLLENAIRHTPPGTRVHAWTAVADGVATIVVEDTGPGIAPELAQRVFERFVRGGGDGGRGSGLGLAIVRSVARTHGGDVALQDSSLGRPGAPGTSFIIRLPAAEPAGSSAPMSDAADNEALTRPAHAATQTSTTTGRTIGRRRSRS